MKQDNENLQSKINELRLQRDKEREQLENQLQDEKKKRTSLEIQLAKEKKSRETAIQAAKSNVPSVNELNRKKISQLENENKELKDHWSKKQETISHLEEELKKMSVLVKSNENIENLNENLKENLKTMEEKNNNLQESLRQETRFKMNLFSALGEAKRQIEYLSRKLF